MLASRVELKSGASRVLFDSEQIKSLHYQTGKRAQGCRELERLPAHMGLEVG